MAVTGNIGIMQSGRKQNWNDLLYYQAIAVSKIYWYPQIDCINDIGDKIISNKIGFTDQLIHKKMICNIEVDCI